jgi:S1-C subfamily serine protease
MQHAVPGVRSASTLAAGERVYAYGFAKGMPAFSAGVFLSIGKLGLLDVRAIATTAHADHGCSGGALFDRFGNLIGVLSAVSDDQKYSYALIADEWWRP